MYKATKLLKVMAILFIVFGVMGAISSMTSKMILEWSESISGIDTGVEVSNLDVILGTAFSLVSVVAGILAVMSKHYKVVWILMGTYMVYLVYSFVVSIQMIGFNAFSMTNFILPALFLWGLYSSRIE